MQEWTERGHAGVKEKNYAEKNNVIKYGGIFIGGGAGHPSKTAYE